MKNLVKKNQLMITALAIMIAIAGYLQFAGTNLEEGYLTVEDGDTSEAGSSGVITENFTSEGLEDAETDELLDLSEEDLMELTDIESLDSEVDVVLEDYLDADMEVVSEDIAEEVTADTAAETSAEVASVTPEDGEIPGEAVMTSVSGVTVLSDAKLLKEQTRAKNKETLLEIIDSAGLSDEQKQDAVDSMVEMTEIAEKESAAEILLEAKGFEGAVVSIDSGTVDVVVNAVELTDAQRAQIEDIVKRKTEISGENIVISTVVGD